MMTCLLSQYVLLIRPKSQDLKNLEAKNKSDTSQITQLKSDIATIQDNAKKAVDARNDDIKKMEGIIASLKLNIEEERKLKDEALQGKSGLESALQKKINQLSNDMAVVQKNAEKAVQEKSQEMDHMSVKIAGLEKELTATQSKSQSTLKERDALLSSMRADLNNLTKLKDEAQKERDMIEKDLSAKNFELKNKISTVKMTADQVSRI